MNNGRFWFFFFLAGAFIYKAEIEVAGILNSGDWDLNDFIAINFLLGLMLRVLWLLGLFTKGTNMTVLGRSIFKIKSSMEYELSLLRKLLYKTKNQ